MLLIQVVLGGAASLLNFPIGVHIVWGIATFAVLIALTALIAKDVGTKSIVFRISIAVIADFVIQGVLGITALIYSSDDIVLVHLTNAFILAVLATTLISFNRSVTPIEESAHSKSASETK